MDWIGISFKLVVGQLGSSFSYLLILHRVCMSDMSVCICVCMQSRYTRNGQQCPSGGGAPLVALQ